MVDQLAQDNVGKPVIFLEYIYATAPDSRKGRFWEAYGGSSAGYPMIIVDSGHQVQSGGVPYYNTYKAMVDQESTRAPQAGIQATWQRIGNKVTFLIQLINHSGVSLSYTQNRATVHALVYEDAKVGVTSRYVRSAVFQTIVTSLAPGSSASFTLETPDLLESTGTSCITWHWWITSRADRRMICCRRRWPFRLCPTIRRIKKS